jgi:hypothetical protein
MLNLYRFDLQKKTWEVITPHVLASIKLVNITQEVLEPFADQHLLELKQL